MNPFATSALVLIFITTSVSADTIISDNYTLMVALNSSFHCPTNDTNCYQVTINDLNERYSVHQPEYKMYLLQSGTHTLVQNANIRPAEILIMKGEVIAIVRCQFERLRIRISATNIYINSLQFQNCGNIEILKSGSTRVEITNCTFNLSNLRIQAPGKGRENALFTTVDNIHAIRSIITFDKSSNLNIRGYSRSHVAISCTNSQFFINIAPKRTVILNSMHVQDCQCIFGSRSKSATVRISKSWFNNSCLKFQIIQTRSIFHTASVTISNTIFERCSCGSVMLFNGSKIHVRVTFYNVNMTNNSSPIMKSPAGDVHLCVYILGSNLYSHNENFIFYLENDRLSFSKSEVHFIDNVVDHNVVLGTPIYAKNSVITFKNSSVLFNQNQGPLCGGIAAESTRMYFLSDVKIKFYANSGLKGGALSLYSGSRLVFNASQSNSTTIEFENNRAQIGGAIYAEDSGYDIESIFYLQCKASHVKLIFGANNLASFSGNQMYGGWIDWLRRNYSAPQNHRDLVNEFVKFESQSNEEVTCNPIRICLCKNNTANCTIVSQPMEIYGHAFSLELVGVGQRYTPVLSHVEASLSSEKVYQSSVEPKTFSLQSHCTTVNYKIVPQSSDEAMTLTPYLPYLYYSTHNHHLPTEDIADYIFQNLSIMLKFNECPWGFHMIDNGSCECQLLSQGLHCDMNNYTILRSGQQWVGVHVTYEHNHGNENPGVISHQHCPFDYCRTDNDSLSIHLDNRDKQCAFNREGILCGGCKENLSRVLGTSNCKKCTNKYTPLIAMSWLISGFILVMCLMLLNLTVSVGTINGLTFYANIIRAQHTTFFTPDDKFLSKFIAWLNLDVGTEMCLYDGLDSYVITWLQYVYPLYIWLIAAIIIILSHYSSRMSKLCGKNILQVLATLFLISYARLLRLMIEVFSFTWITYPDGHKKVVWLVDGNYNFFKGKLIPLVLVTIILVLLSLPYTFILLTIQLLQKMSHYRILFWVQRLKPFFDAYTGPYKSRHRYWTGLLLVARIALLITFSVNQSNNPSINLLAIITVSVVLLGWLSSANWVYNSPLNNFLEIIFLGNLGLTSAAVLFNVSNGKSSPAAIYFSTSVAFALLIFIILYHIYRRLVLTKLGSKLTVKVMRVLPIKSVTNADDLDDSVELSDIDPPTPGHSEVTTTMVDLNQAYSHTYDSYNSHDLKEPLLEDDN